MSGSKRVFILGGGAALGAHQVGALRLLDERDVRPDAILGSSIGVINACLYATGGVDLLEQVWSDARTLPGIGRPSLRHNPFFGRSLFDVGPAIERIESAIDFEKCRRSPLELAFIVLNLSRGTAEIITNREVRTAEEMRTLVRAGYAVPFLFPPVRFRGDTYVDGGFAWNIPFDHAFEIGATEIWILAVIASRLPYKKRFGGFVGFATRFLDVMWRTLGNMGHLYAGVEKGEVRGVPVVLIEPGEELSGFGLFDVFHAHPTKTRRLREAGYRDAKRVLHRLKRQGRLPPSRA